MDNFADIDLVDPNASSPYNALPIELRRTLMRSFRAMTSGAPDSEKNLWNATDWGQTKRATLWETLDHLKSTDLNTIVRVFERVQSISPRLWEGIEWIRNVWCCSSAGFLCKLFDRSAYVKDLGFMVHVCQDFTLGAKAHPGCDCWREIPTSGMESLHFCLGTTDPALDQVHVDWFGPATGYVPFTGTCYYDPVRVAVHLTQVFANQGFEDPPFDWVITDVASARSRVAAAQAARPKERTKWERLQGKLDRIDSNWQLQERSLACQGASGWRTASGLRSEIGAISSEAE